jgi:hypothetical protein
MRRNFLFLAVGAAIVNGIFSPFLVAVFIFYPIWYPTWAPAYTQIVLMLSSLILSTLTLMAAGVPAALYERYRKQQGTDASSAGIWFAAAVLLTLPALPNVLRALNIG